MTTATRKFSDLIGDSIAVLQGINLLFSVYPESVVRCVGFTEDLDRALKAQQQLSGIRGAVDERLTELKARGWHERPSAALLIEINDLWCELLSARCLFSTIESTLLFQAISLSEQARTLLELEPAFRARAEALTQIETIVVESEVLPGDFLKDVDAQPGEMGFIPLVSNASKPDSELRAILERVEELMRLHESGGRSKALINKAIGGILYIVKSSAEAAWKADQAPIGRNKDDFAPVTAWLAKADVFVRAFSGLFKVAAEAASIASRASQVDIAALLTKIGEGQE